MNEHFFFVFMFWSILRMTFNGKTDKRLFAVIDDVAANPYMMHTFSDCSTASDRTANYFFFQNARVLYQIRCRIEFTLRAPFNQ